jgi:hypothetical protein
MSSSYDLLDRNPQLCLQTFSRFTPQTIVFFKSTAVGSPNF